MSKSTCSTDGHFDSFKEFYAIKIFVLEIFVLCTIQKYFPTKEILLHSKKRGAGFWAQLVLDM